MVFDDTIYYLLNCLQKEIIKRNKKSILDYLNIYQNFLNFYRPKAIILPSGDSFHFNLLCQLAKKNMTKTILSVDGYQTIKEYQGLMYETKKKDTLFDFIFCPGKSYKKLMVDLKIKKKKLIQINPPIFSNYKLLENKNFL